MNHSPRPNKNLGQHWLYDQVTLEAICNAANIDARDTVLEIGPGLGTLTEILVGKASQVVAVEFDKELARDLPTRIPEENLEVINADILHFDLARLPLDYKVVANVPYYITSKITRMLLEAKNPPKTTVLLVQKEVAERMAATPGDMSILAIAVQYYAEAALGPEVPAELFTPPPKVDSQVIILKRRPERLYPDVPTKEFFVMVRAGFSEKRKKLRNSLSGGLRLDKAEVDALLAKAGVPSESRAEDLSLDDWYNIVKAYKGDLS